MSDSIRDLTAAAQAHMDAGRFAEAEVAIRLLIDRIAPDDHLRLWIEFVSLAGVLNMLERADEGTEMYRRALEEAERLPSGKEAGAARYMLANQYLIFGDPRDALETADPIPQGVGHVQCLLHGVVAEAHWKLEQRDEARTAAKRAIEPDLRCFGASQTSIRPARRQPKAASQVLADEIGEGSVAVGMGRNQPSTTAQSREDRRQRGLAGVSEN